MSVSNVPPEGTPEGARAAGRGYWFTPVPVYLLDAAYDPDSPVNAPAVILWAHVHRHYAWRERVFPSYARLAEETRQSESAVKRQLNVLKAAGAITWGATYRARGRSSNEYALAPMEPFRFDREIAPPVQVKSDLHSPVGVRSEPPVEVENDPYPQVENDPGVESSSYLESTDELLSPPPLPAQRPEPDPVHEREIPVSNDQPSTAQRVVRAAGVVTAEEEEAFIAWTTAKHQPRSSAWWRTVSGNGDLPGLAADWRAQGGLDATTPLTGTDATVAGWLSLAGQLGGRQPHQPYRDDPWHHIKQQAAAGDRPDGWERVPFCGHLDCDETTRMRQVDTGDGIKSPTYCSGCHPALQF